ncbi:MAG TPA: hypothetical protein VGM39_23755 [Kofleriaceae bacterium]
MSSRTWWLVLATAVSASVSADPVEYRVSLDTHLGMQSGVSTGTTLARLALRGEDVLLERATLSPPVAMLARVSAGLLFDAPVAIEGVVLPHELFGHGARAREFGFEPSYDLHIAPPYAWFIGSALQNHTMWDSDRSARPATPDEEAMFITGGLETQELQRRSLAFDAFRARTLTRSDALMYLTASIETISYTQRSSGDIAGYYDHLSTRYGADRDHEQRRTRISGFVAAADPLLLVSLYSYFYRYLVRGDRSLAYPSMTVGPLEASLTEGVLLVPWGREHQLTALLGGTAGNFAATLGAGEGSRSSYSASLVGADLPLGPLYARTRIDIARQPTLGVIDRDEPSPPVLLGGKETRRTLFDAEVGVDYRYARYVVGAQVGWKTDGYAPGLPYASAWTGTLSLGVRLPP